jgi:uncharacterized protein with HEPN domain
MNLPTQLAYLKHVRDALLAVQEYTRDGRESFFASKMVQDAVLRNLEVIGEAVKALDDVTKQHAPDVPWRRVAGMRDVLIHHYFGVDLEVAWRVVEADAPNPPVLDVTTGRELSAAPISAQLERP